MLSDYFYDYAAQIKGQDIFIWADNEVLDFTSNKKYNINISTSKQIFTFPIDISKIVEFYSFLNDLGSLNPVVFAWNFKNINSYFLHKAKKTFDFNNLYDLKIIEEYYGLKRLNPQDFNEAKNRLLGLSEFGKFKKIWQQVYLPLISEVIPHIENTPLVSKDIKNYVYPYYEIGGQVNGRMKCNSSYFRGYNPHSLRVDNKINLTSPGYEDNFLYFDFKSHEVCVLQWLSGDEELRKIIDSGDDIYARIWEKITGITCDTTKRAICKSIFLPIIFGQGIKATAEIIKISESSAKKIIDNIYNSFPNALKYVEQLPENGKITDYFGKTRLLNGEAFKARNFLVQSPASIICFHKLVELYKKIKNKAKICYHLHDGFCIIVNNQNLSQVLDLGKEVLQASSDLYPGLKLKIDVRIGRSLTDL
jgi:hypothetical protein